MKGRKNNNNNNNKVGLLNCHFSSAIFIPRANVLCLYPRTFFPGDIFFFKTTLVITPFFFPFPFLSHLTLAKVNGSLFPWDWRLDYRSKRKMFFIFFSSQKSCFSNSLIHLSLLWLPPSHISTASWFSWFSILEMLGRQLSWGKLRRIKRDADLKDGGSAPWTATAALRLCLGLA